MFTNFRRTYQLIINNEDLLDIFRILDKYQMANPLRPYRMRVAYCGWKKEPHKMFIMVHAKPDEMKTIVSEMERACIFDWYFNL